MCSLGWLGLNHQVAPREMTQADSSHRSTTRPRVRHAACGNVWVWSWSGISILYLSREEEHSSWRQTSFYSNLVSSLVHHFRFRLIVSALWHYNLNMGTLCIMTIHITTFPLFKKNKLWTVNFTPKQSNSKHRLYMECNTFCYFLIITSLFTCYLICKFRNWLWCEVSLYFSLYCIELESLPCAQIWWCIVLFPPVLQNVPASVLLLSDLYMCLRLLLACWELPSLSMVGIRWIYRTYVHVWPPPDFSAIFLYVIW